MPRPDRPAPSPLDAAALERLALRYVERYATTRAKLGRYLHDKVRARGFSDGDPPIDGLVERMAALGYVDDAAFAAARAGTMARRGLGARRVAGALRQAGVSEQDTAAAVPQSADTAQAAALAYARRRRIGPYAAAPADRVLAGKHVAALVRAGHDFALARRIVALAPGEEVPESWD